MQWSHPDTLGDIPPPCRAHTATLVDKKIVIIGGGEGPVYYNDIYVLDTLTRTWSRPHFPAAPPSPDPEAASMRPTVSDIDPTRPPPVPPPRRAHTAVLYRGKIWVFGGGNGTQALNDLWTLEVGHNAAVEKMKWELVTASGKMPSPRGYHTANLVGNVMVVMGGSDGKECFSDIWCLNLGARRFSASMGRMLESADGRSHLRFAGLEPGQATDVISPTIAHCYASWIVPIHLGRT